MVPPNDTGSPDNLYSRHLLSQKHSRKHNRGQRLEISADGNRLHRQLCQRGKEQIASDPGADHGQASEGI